MENRRIISSSEIKNILLNYWDPIGVNGFSEAKDEYDGYIDDIIMIIVDGSKYKLRRYLLWAERDHMGLGA